MAMSSGSKPCSQMQHLISPSAQCFGSVCARDNIGPALAQAISGAAAKATTKADKGRERLRRRA